MTARTEPSAEDVYVGTKEVEERHRFDYAKLEAWMKTNVEGYQGPLQVLQFKGGQSNPTYRLNTPARSYVLRRKPFGKLLPSAHAVDREFKVISALHKVGFPVAKPHSLCMDDGVIGAAFYIMSMVEGRSLWTGTLPGMTPAQRRAIYEAEIKTLARLHSYDPAMIGLSEFGKPGNYFVRQIDRWTKQYRASETRKIPEMERLIEWLPKTVPAQDRTSIVHGDYRLDNMLFHAEKPEVLAVLDWELSTLGDPLADFTYYLMHWVMPADGRSGLGGLDLKALGIPSIEETVAHYCNLTGRDGLPDLWWYFSYNLFRLAGILQGIVKRVEDGTAASANPSLVTARVDKLASGAWDFALKAGAKA
jgi:aminoglycoside phosphotransferase (APT) family kinase protein